MRNLQIVPRRILQHFDMQVQIFKTHPNKYVQYAYMRKENIKSM